MSDNPTKTRHAVLTGDDFHFLRDSEKVKATEIKLALEEKFPSASVDFAFKLLPLSVGACLLIISESLPWNHKVHKHRRAGRMDCEVLNCVLLEVKVEDAVAAATELAARWHRKAAKD